MTVNSVQYCAARLRKEVEDLIATLPGDQDGGLRDKLSRLEEAVEQRVSTLSTGVTTLNLLQISLQFVIALNALDPRSGDSEGIEASVDDLVGLVSTLDSLFEAIGRFDLDYADLLSTYNRARGKREIQPAGSVQIAGVHKGPRDRFPNPEDDPPPSAA